MHGKKPIIGLCGGIGAGKSLVAAEFERLGCLVVDSDRLNHVVMGEAGVRETLRQWWGDAALDATGAVDRRRVAEIVFREPAEKRRLESLVYPLIAERRAAMIRAVEGRSAVKAIVIDSPLLFESNLARECDTIVFVDASESQRLRRLSQERGWDAAELKRRERWQLALVDKRSQSEFVITNDGRRELVRPQVVNILKQIVSRHS